MYIIKYLLIAVIIIIHLPLFAQKKKVSGSFELKGSIAGLNSTKMILATRNAQDSVQYDTTDIVDGNFLFKGKLNEPTISALWTIDPGFMNEQFIENTHMTITRKDTLSQIEFSGSLTEKDNEVRNQCYSDFYSEVRKADSAAKKILITDTAAAAAYYQNTSKKLLIDLNECLKKFISHRPKSPVSVFELSRQTERWDPQDVQALFDGLDKSMQQSSYGKKTLENIAARRNTAIGVKAQTFIQKNVDGIDISLSSFRGKYLLIDFWASWCGPCRVENPNLVKSYQKYKEKGFEIIGISLDENADKWKEAIIKDQLIWQQVSDLKGWKNDIAKQYNITAVPANFLIDPNGIIIAKNLRGEDLEKKLSEILK